MPTFQVWNKCNNKCTMCTNPLWLDSDNLCQAHSFRLKAKEIFDSMSRRPEGEMIQFTGGEPTIHPDFFKLLFWTRSEFTKSRIYLITNGRMFFYEDFTKGVLSVNNLTIQLAILGHNSDLHDKITNTPKSFNQTVAGIKNILKYKKENQELELRIVLTKVNIPFLDNILEFIYSNFREVDFLVIIFPEPEGKCEVNFDNIGLKYSEVKKTIKSIIPSWSKKFKELRLYHFPLCQLDQSLWHLIYRTLPPEEISFIDTCNNCNYKEYCLGIQKDYLKIVGSDEFISIKNNYNIKTQDDKHHPIIG